MPGADLVDSGGGGWFQYYPGQQDHRKMQLGGISGGVTWFSPYNPSCTDWWLAVCEIPHNSPFLLLWAIFTLLDGLLCCWEFMQGNSV